MNCEKIYLFVLLGFIAKCAFSEKVQSSNTETEDNSELDGEKRNVGRWKNFRYLLGGKDAIHNYYKNPYENRYDDKGLPKNKDEKDKRFFGRWRDVSNRFPKGGNAKRLPGSNENADEHMTSMMKSISLDKDFMKEIADVNNFKLKK